MSDRSDNCLFCTVSRERVVAQNELAFALRDTFPVSHLHSLVLPKRHVADYFDLTSDEVTACHELLSRVREDVCAQDRSVAGFNVGVNSGQAAGQTIFHCHFHLIPRRVGDVANPRGGVRHVIPGRGNY